MKKITILKGFQTAINQFPYINNTKQLVKKIRFDSSCVYAIGLENQQDWNILMGFSYGLMPYYSQEDKKYIKPSSYNSVNFCWRYNIETNKIEVGPLYLMNGFKCFPQNSFHKIVSLDLDTEYLFSIYTQKNTAELILSYLGEPEFYRWKVRCNPKSYGWIRPMKFGNKKAPHTIQVEQERIK